MSIAPDHIPTLVFEQSGYLLRCMLSHDAMLVSVGWGDDVMCHWAYAYLLLCVVYCVCGCLYDGHMSFARAITWRAHLLLRLD